MYPEMYNTTETVDGWRNDDSHHENRVHTPSSPPHRGWHSEQQSSETDINFVKSHVRVVKTEPNRGTQWHQADLSATRVMSPGTPPRGTPVPLVITEQNHERIVMAEHNQERLVLAEQNQERLVLSEQQRAILSEQQRALLSADQHRAILSSEQQRAILSGAEQQRLVITQQQRTVLTEQQRALLSEQHRAGLPPR